MLFLFLQNLKIKKTRKTEYDKVANNRSCRLFGIFLQNLEITKHPHCAENNSNTFKETDLYLLMADNLHMKKLNCTLANQSLMVRTIVISE